jgi:ABC-2 type transport system permease protein
MGLPTGSKEIEDRLLAPLSTNMVAIEKMLIATLRGLVAAVVMFPIAALVLGSAPWRTEGLPVLAVVLALGTWVGAGIGMTIGTAVQPAKISIMFALVFTPLIFTGSTQYPLPLLKGDLRWFQIVSGLNPLTYVSEGVRGALVPTIPHLPGLYVRGGAGRFRGAVHRDQHPGLPAQSDRLAGNGTDSSSADHRPLLACDS